MSKWYRLVVILGLILLSACQADNNGATNNSAAETVVEPTATPEPVGPLVGTWRLVSWKLTQVNGTVNEPYGSSPLGQLMYDNAGHMSAHVASPDRPVFASDMFGDFTPDEAMMGLVTYIAYFGTYTLDEAAGTVTHAVTASTFPNWTGVDQVRAYELAGDRLTLRTVEPMPGPGGGVNQELVWERLP